MNQDSHKIKLAKKISESDWSQIELFCKNKTIKDLKAIVEWLISEFNIDITTDFDIVKGYIYDWSNIKGNAIGVCRPKNEYESIILMRTFYLIKIPYTISSFIEYIAIYIYILI